MAILLAGNTVIDDAGTGYFNQVNISSNGYIEIPDTNTAVNANSIAFLTRKNHSYTLNNAMWSWWTTPKILRHSNESNNWTYTSYTDANGSVGLAITNHTLGVTDQYIVNSSLVFTADDHNAGAIVAGNNKVAVFMQGRVATAPANSNNMFYIEFDEGTSPVDKPVVNVTFSVDTTSTVSFYPAPFNANGKFILIGRQQQANTSNQWLAVTGDWPLANLSQPKGFFKSGYSWPYFAIRRSLEDKDVINFALSWHPFETTANHSIHYGKILRNGNTDPWDVWSNNSIIGNLTTEAGLPFNEDDFEIVYTTNNFALLLDGTSDYLDLPANSAFALGTGNFTVECFIRTTNKTSDTVFRRIYMTDGPAGNVSGNFQIGIDPTTGFVNFYDASGLNILGATDVSDGKWHHIAASRDGSTIRLFVDSYSQNSATYTTNISPNSGSPRPRIGSFNGTQGDFDGYISNLRVIKGTSLYSTNTFSQFYPTTPVTNLANTQLLTLQSNTIVDLSNNNFTITANGNARMVQNTGPFMPDSLRLFDVHDDAIAFGTFRTDQNIIQYKMAYKTGNTWSVTTVCDGGNPFHGVGVRDYYGGMSISERDKYTVTLAAEIGDNEWEIREYKTSNVGNPWVLQDVYRSAQYTVAARPMEESLSEDAMIYNNTDTLGSAYFMGEFDGSDFTSFNTNIYTFRSMGPGVSNTMLDVDRTTYLNKFNVAIGSSVTINSELLSSGYNAGGIPGSPGVFNTIDKFSFAADGSATDVADLSRAKSGASGQSSSVNGYSSSGFGTAFVTEIDRFPFAINNNATYVGNLTIARFIGAGQSSSTHGYMSGGTIPPSADTNTIDRYPFFADVISSDVGDLLTSVVVGGAGQQSSTHGYMSGGGSNFPAPTAIASFRTIQKFSFAESSTNAALVGNLSANTRVATGQSSTTHGYTSGGFTPTPGTPTFYTTIAKFPFASDVDSTDVATLTEARTQSAGQSSTTHGYTSGGQTPPATTVNTIDKFPFATDTNATDVGDLTIARYYSSGAQG